MAQKKHFRLLVFSYVRLVMLCFYYILLTLFNYNFCLPNEFGLIRRVYKLDSLTIMLKKEKIGNKDMF